MRTGSGPAVGNCGELWAPLAIGACVVLLPWAAGAGPRVVGAPETVFDWSSAACADWDIPDTPARAWRSADGMVHLLAGAEESRASVGPDLDEVEHDCTVLHRGAHSDDPGAYDDRAWIHATYAEGDRVTALAHVEFHGHRRPGLCASRDRGDCWRNAIVELRSDDGGRTFRRVGLVAALPYRYAGEGAGRSGYFNPSNIIRRGDYLHAFVMAERTGAQRRGPCLLRRPLGGGPGDWRGWDGGGFTVRFADPYREDLADPARHVCAPVEGIGSTLSSVVERAGTYLAVTAATRARPDAAERSGIYWTISRDLVHWSPPALLWAAPLLWRRGCAAPAAYAYPALLDGDSASASFETVDDGFWLYLVEMRLGPGCSVGRDRDLIRLPVSWPSP